MNPLHSELLTLFNNDTQLAKDLDEASAYSRKAQHALAVSHSKRLIPSSGPGKQHWRHSFWGQFEERLIMRFAFYGSAEKQQECQRWLSKNLPKAARAVSVSFRPPPQPRTGRE